MTVLPIKPASFAGFLLLSNILNVALVVAQDYVDVEAERRAAAHPIQTLLMRRDMRGSGDRLV